jgi:predicted DNA-binding transcriptional regulator AlpA
MTAPTWWTYADLARTFGLSEDVVRRRMRAWAAEGFPAPLPWSRRSKRWDPASVLRWKARREIRAGAAAPQLVGAA